MFSYKPLWKLLINKNMTKTEMRKKIGFSMTTLANMSKNKYVSMSLLNKICNEFNCNIEDIIKHEKE